MDDQATDEEILHQFHHSAKPKQAFRLLVIKYQERLYWHIRRMVVSHDDADDVLQEVFIRAWKALPNFRQESGLYTWLYRIATNESLTHLKKQKRHFTIGLDEDENGVAEQLAGDPFFDGSHAEALLHAAIQTLPAKQRVVFNMKYFDELKYEEIAQVTGTSVGALKASYFHAVKKIEAFLKSRLNQ